MKQSKSKSKGPRPAPVAPAAQLCALIAQQPFFKGLSQRQFQILSTLAMIRDFKPGDCILKEGEPANRFYLILSGKVEMQSETSDSRIPVQTLGPGDDLGWSWLFPPYYFHGTAQVIEPAKTIFFYGTRLRELCEDDHDLGYEIMKRVAQVAIQNLNATRRGIESINAKTLPAPKRK